ncbi:MAG: hypothetical protein C4576_05675 [Desulfobacteraceae bacterium]|nr:MAG: hypothetical protein C4576_05675 [Desulfobacteraceae bacterium]
MEKKKSRMAMLKNAKAAIHAVFDRLPQAALKGSDIEGILEQNRRKWQLSDWTTTYEFLQFMLEESKLRMVRFEFPGRTVLRYTWGDASIYEMALSLRGESYFSHQTAIYLHGLTEEVPKTIYLNSEQTPKPQSSENLSQSGIDRAFRGKPRMSGNIAPHGDSSICILNGKSSGKVGVVDIETPDGKKAPVTGLERTLVDITVRPFYAGDVLEVLKVFQKAGGKISLTRCRLPQ